MQRKNGKNKCLTPLSVQCRLCHYSGYSNDCNFATVADCPLVKSQRIVKQNQPGTTPESVAVVS